jgi:hypothetical protein
MPARCSEPARVLSQWTGMNVMPAANSRRHAPAPARPPRWRLLGRKRLPRPCCKEWRPTARRASGESRIWLRRFAGCPVGQPAASLGTMLGGLCKTLYFRDQRSWDLQVRAMDQDHRQGVLHNPLGTSVMLIAIRAVDKGDHGYRSMAREFDVGGRRGLMVAAARDGPGRRSHRSAATRHGP